MTRQVFAMVLMVSAPVFAQDARRAVVKPIALLQKTSVQWYSKQTCTSCHQQDLPMMVLRLARERGVAIDDGLRREVVARGYGFLSSIDRAVQHTHLIDPSMDYGMHLLGAHDAGVPPSLSTGEYARFIANRQKPDGHWITIDERPPQAHSLFTATAISMRAVQLYMPARLQPEMRERVTRARQWLASNAPVTTEDRVFQLRGLSWAGADAATLGRLAAPLVAQQRPDGGWAQLPSLESDAYATGEVLATLRESAQMPASAPEMEKGLRYLQRTQLPDGTWRVKSRMHEQQIVSPPYFESGFPHGANQMVSAMGTAWATAALLLSIEPPAAPPAPVAIDRAAVTAPGQPWMETALFGTPAELRSLLDRGLDPNSHTPDGTTLLMMSAHDPAKVRLAVERGANVNARAKSGFTALMVAANYAGNAESMRLLLARGAAWRNLTDPKPLFDASALFYAVLAGDVGNVEALAPSAADLRRKMTIIGLSPVRPIDMAAVQRDVPMLRYLVSRGIDVNEDDPDAVVSPLSEAVLENDVPTARALLELHADPNKMDLAGMSPLLHAAAVDYGDVEMAKLLLASGANPKIRTKAQQTPEQLAQLYGHTALARVLADRK